MYTYILFLILFPYRLLQDIMDSFLCYIVGPCCLSILYIVVCIYCKRPTLNQTEKPHKYFIFVPSHLQTL